MRLFKGLVFVIAGMLGPAWPASAQVSTRDSAGMTIITARVAGVAATRTWTLGSPVLSIGNEGGDERYTLDAVSDAMRLADGRIVVAEGRASRLRVYNSSGEHIADWGRSGDGLGSFGGSGRCTGTEATQFLSRALALAVSQSLLRTAGSAEL